MTDQQLRRLADAHRVAVRYLDWRDQPVAPSPETLRAVLGALGVDAATPGAVAEGLRELAAAPRLPALSVVRHGAPLPVPPGVRVRLETADGVHPVGAGGRLPDGLPVGWYRLHGGATTTELAYVPDRMALPAGLAGRRLAGLMVQLYSTRSAGSWKFGDLGDLAALARWSGGLGAGFTLVNPLHAGGPVTPLRPSPYLPASRRFASPLYLRIEQLPEYAALPAPDRERLAALAGRARDTPDGLIDRDAVWTAKRDALARLHQVPLTEPRRAAYAEFTAREGQALTDFATWCALVEAYADRYGPVWRQWPAELRDPRSARVAAEAERLGVRVDFHRWLQWQLDQQLAAAQTAAREAGMPLGLLHDLAVGADSDGADSWMYQHVLAAGATVGAPPDAFNRLGQDWRQPPWHPERLADAAYLPYRELVRFWLRHGGGLRADHVMGLFRLWWVPDGADPTQGTYVKYDHEAMVGILALEAQLADAVVVGEDLGVVEPWVREHLTERGILATSLLWFEESKASGEPRPPDQWRELCLATVDSHDMPPIAGYATGEYLAVRQRLGILGQPESRARAELSGKLVRWRRTLVALGLLDEDETDPTAALHGFLTRTPAMLVGLSLTDLVGERRSQNLPGTDQEYPNWRIPLGDGAGREVLLDELVTRDDIASAVRAVTAALSQLRAGR